MTFTRQEPRPIRIEGPVAYVPLTQGLEAIIDAEDAERVGLWTWCAARHRSGYICAMRREPGGGRRGQRRIRLHHEVLGVKVQVDHKNLNALDCRKDNLRLATAAQNNMNKGVQKNNVLGVKGVRQERSGKFMARITEGGHTRYLGTFDTIEAASDAYVRAAATLHGEFARAA